MGIQPSDTGGSSPPEPPNDTVEVIPARSFPMGNYAVFGLESVNISDRDTVKNGKVGSNMYIEVGCDALVKGDIVSGGNLFLRERATILGSVQIAGAVTKQNGTSISGDEADSMSFEPMILPVVTVTPGTDDSIIPVNQTKTIEPGAYNILHAYAGATVKLKPGAYQFRKFILEPDVHLVAELNGGAPVIVNILEQFSFGDRCVSEFPAGKEFPLAVQFYTAQTSQVFIGNQVVFKGVICAPNAEIAVNTNSDIFGGIYGKRVVIQPGTVICKPPALADLYHSEITFTPTFDPLNMFYKTIISPDITSLNVVPTAEDTGMTITVSGHSSAIPVVLNGITNDITIDLIDSSGCGSSRYVLRVQRLPNYMIYVNDDSPCTPGTEDGESWATAWKDLQDALDNAAVTGREIWVAEGTYKPSRRTDSIDPRSATFIVQRGIEIIGGFHGNETIKKRNGSPFNTVFSGDLQNNDSLVKNWPPLSDTDFIALSENSYHVVTVQNRGAFPGVQLTGVFITKGFADSLHLYKGSGAGVFTYGKLCDMQECIISRNYSVRSGSGVYCEKSPDMLTNCLFENNITLNGSGAGLYVSAGDSMTLVGCIFGNNTQLDTLATTGGAAFYNNCKKLYMANTVFAGNSTTKKGGALVNFKGVCKLVNCTFSGNSALDTCQSIYNDSGIIHIVNTILWNDSSRTEINSEGVSASYSCVTNGFPGTGNSSINPLFVNKMQPEGTDGLYGTTDDGLRLSSGSICIDRGISGTDIPVEDILYTERENPDIGAYEYFVIQDFDKVFGYINPSGIFIEDDTISVVDTIWHWWYVNVYAKSNYGLVAKILIKKDKYSKKISNFYTLLYPLDTYGNEISGVSPVRINLYKAGEENGMFVFLTKTSTQGKPIVFVGEPLYHNWTNTWAYVVYANSSNFKAITPSSQF